MLHKDASLMPSRRKRAWAAWNYHMPRRTCQQHVAVTYQHEYAAGPLQALACSYLVTLNPAEA